VTVTGARAARPGPAGVGLALAVISAATFGTSGTFASSLIQAGWSPAGAADIRIAVSALILTGPALMQLRGRWHLLRRAAPRVAGYGLLAVAGCQLFYFNAVQRIPVGVALLLEYLGTVLVVGWMWLRHGDRPRRLTVTGAVSAIAGLFLVLNLTGSARIDPIGVMWGLLAAVGLATYFVLSASAADPLPPITMAWGGMCVGAAALAVLGGAGVLPLATPAVNVRFLGHWVSWIVPVLGLSLLAAVVAYVAGIGAARRLGAKLASFIGMAEVLFAVLFAWLLLGQLPSPVQFLGGAFILAGIALVRAGELGADRVPGAGARPAGRAGRRRCGTATGRGRPLLWCRGMHGARGGSGSGRDFRRRGAARGRPGVGRRARRDRGAAQPGHRRGAADAGGVQPADGASHHGPHPGRARPAGDRPPGGQRPARAGHGRRSRRAIVARLPGRRAERVRALADGPARHRGQYRRRSPARSQPGRAGRPGSHADQGVAGRRGPGPGAERDPGGGFRP